MLGYIFSITNVEDDFRIYIGASRRKFNLVQNSYWHQATRDRINEGSMLFEAMRKYSKKAFVWKVIEDGIHGYAELFERKRAFVELYGSANPDIGYNVNDGISVDPHRASWKPPRFICEETGEGFASVYEIAAREGLAQQTVGRLIRSGKPVKDHNYRVLGFTGEQ